MTEHTNESALEQEAARRLEAMEGEALRHADTLEKYADALDRADKAVQTIAAISEELDLNFQIHDNDKAVLRAIIGKHGE